MPAACQNGAETTDIEQQPDTEQTASHQESRSWPWTTKRPCKRQVSGSNPLTGSIDLQVRDVFLASGGSRTRGHGTSDPFHERDISAAAAAADRFVGRVSAKSQRGKCYLAIACGIVAASGCAAREQAPHNPPVVSHLVGHQSPAFAQAVPSAASINLRRIAHARRAQPTVAESCGS